MKIEGCEGLKRWVSGIQKRQICHSLLGAAEDPGHSQPSPPGDWESPVNYDVGVTLGHLKPVCRDRKTSENWVTLG